MSPRIAVVMGSQSDWSTMTHCCETLEDLGLEYEKKIVSAHRTPKLLAEFAESARENGFQIIIAAAGGAAHLPGMLAAHTSLPVLGVPIKSSCLSGVDSLLSIVQMPRGVPVGTLAIGEAGAVNAALFAAAMLAGSDPLLLESVERFRKNQTESVLKNSVPGE